jgi:catechol 2,3-dioxygenase-like lactoylglutathione lyase family enzyme
MMRNDIEDASGPAIEPVVARAFVSAEESTSRGHHSQTLMANLALVALVVREYKPAIEFFVDLLGFELVEDVPSMTNDGRPKRWVVVRPRGGQTGILLARADGAQQAAVVGAQFAGRVGLFLRVEDFDATHARLLAAGVEFVTAPRVEPYGKVAVFRDLEGNRWDLLGPVAGA